MLLLAAAALAQDAAPPPLSKGFRQARAVTITGAAMTGAGALVLAVGLAGTGEQEDQGGCVDWCGDLGIRLVALGLGTALVVPGALLTVGGAIGMADQRSRQVALVVGPGSVGVVGTF